MSGGDDDDRGERPKLSWSELDKRRDRPRSHTPERAPRGAAAEARARRAAQSYLAKLDDRLFAKGAKGGAVGSALATAVRDARGTPGLADACRAYLERVGAPREAGLIGAFLDAPDRAIQLAALAPLAEEVAARRIGLTSGLRSRLRNLAEGADDELAEGAEEILRSC